MLNLINIHLNKIVKFQGTKLIYRRVTIIKPNIKASKNLKIPIYIGKKI